MVNPTNPPGTIYPTGTPVAKADVRQWMNEMVVQVNGELVYLSRDAGVTPLINVAGTANAILADFPEVSPGQSFTAGRLIRLIPIFDATIASATLTVAGVTRTIRDADLSAFPAPFLKAGRSYIFETSGAGLQMSRAPPTQSRQKFLPPWSGRALLPASSCASCPLQMRPSLPPRSRLLA